MDDIQGVIGRVKQTISVLKITNAEFARRIEIGNGNLSSYLSGRRPITDYLLMKISNEFGIDYDWLKLGVNRMTTKGFSPAKLSSRSSRLEAIRTALNLTIEEFAMRTNMAPENVQNIEAGKDSLTVVQYENIGYAFNVNLDYLLNGNGEMFRQPDLDSQRRIGDLTVKEFETLVNKLLKNMLQPLSN